MIEDDNLIIDAFKREFKDLLTKYKAEITIEDKGINWEEHIPYFEISLNGYRQVFDISKTTIYPEML